MGGRHQAEGDTFIRSRLVARAFCEMGVKGEDVFAATPPLDTLKSMLALSLREDLKVMVLKTKNAHPNGAVKHEGGPGPSSAKVAREVLEVEGETLQNEAGVGGGLRRDAGDFGHAPREGCTVTTAWPQGRRKVPKGWRARTGNGMM